MGVAIATSVSLILGPIYFFIKLHHYFQISLKNFVQEVVPVPLIASIIPSVLIYGLNSGVTLTSNQLENLIIFAFGGILFMGIYLTVMLRNKYLDKYDINLLKSHFALSGILNLQRAKKRNKC